MMTQEPSVQPTMSSPEQVRQQHEAWMEKLRRMRETSYRLQVSNAESPEQTIRHNPT